MATANKVTKKTLSRTDMKELSNYDVIVFSRSKAKKILLIVFILALVAVIALVSLKYTQARNETRKIEENLKRLSDPNNSARDAEDLLIAQVQKVAIVPKDERPTIATVTDANKLKSQALFSQVENGDKILLYSKARRQIVFRPSKSLVITAVTLPESTTTTDSSQPAPAESTTPAQ